MRAAKDGNITLPSETFIKLPLVKTDIKPQQWECYCQCLDLRLTCTLSHFHSPDMEHGPIAGSLYYRGDTLR